MGWTGFSSKGGPLARRFARPGELAGRRFAHQEVCSPGGLLTQQVRSSMRFVHAEGLLLRRFASLEFRFPEGLLPKRFARHDARSPGGSLSQEVRPPRRLAYPGGSLAGGFASQEARSPGDSPKLLPGPGPGLSHRQGLGP